MKARKCIYFLLTCCVLVFTSGTNAGARPRDLREALQSLGPDDEVAVIVKLADQVDVKQFKDRDKALRRTKMIKELTEKASRTQGPVRAFLEKKKARKIKPLWIINGIAATVPARVVRELALQPGVESISLDNTLSVPVTTAGTTAAEWNLSAIRAPELWSLGYTGQGVVVANMDTGVDVNHPDLQTRWRGGANSWFDPNGEHASPYDADGHGTQTMGILVGGDAGGTSIGVAPGAKWMAVKMYNDAGIAAYSVIHQGFQWLLDPDGVPATDDAPRVVNLSWGLIDQVNTCDPVFQPDIQALKTAEIFVAVAAGNAGPASSTSMSPANYPESLSVGSIGSSLIVEYSSSRGPSACQGDAHYPDVAAPGVSIYTTDLTFGGVIPNSYGYFDGTSFAAPHLAGAAALLLDAMPDLTVSEIETALTTAATDLGDIIGPDNDYGNGLVNAYGAYSALKAGGEPDIAVSPASLDFGTVLLFRTSYRTATIKNSGRSDLKVTHAEVVGTNAAMFSITNWAGQMTILPDMSESLRIVFRPTSRGIKMATLRLFSNDLDSPVVEVPLTGTGR